jgi:ubiquitin C-terminal hydrolase
MARNADRFLRTPTEGQDLTKSYFPLTEATTATCEECGKKVQLCRRDHVRQRWVCLVCIDKEASRHGVSRAAARLLRRG